MALSEVGDARRARMLAVSQQVPNYLWIGLILSAVLLVVTSALRIESLTWPGIVGIGGLALLVSGVLTMLSAMNHPFGGGIHVEPDALKFALPRFSVI
ncbi:bestrophin-like domain [Kitasatospora sp. P5_F3]